MRQLRIPEVLLLTSMAVAAMVSASVPSFGPLRLPLAIALVVALPGYALTGLLYRRREIDLAARTAISLGASLALAALGGLALQLTPWGIRSEAWAVLLGGFTVSVCVATAVLDHRAQAPGSYVTLTLPILNRVRTMNLLLCAGALCIAVIAIQVARDGAQSEPEPGFMQLWLIQGTDSSHVVVGLHSNEQTDTAIRVVVAQGPTVFADFPITVQPSQDWQQTLRVPSAQSASQPVVATAFRVGAPSTVLLTTRLSP